MLIDVANFDTNYFRKFETISKNKRKGIKHYLDVITAFDIETTSLLDIKHSFMYVWQFNINEDITVIGHYWNEWLDLLEKIKEVLPRGVYLPIYVHNLSFEFQYLKGIYDFETEEVFATDRRKILKCTMYDCIEYRCSMQLTNMSLLQLTKKYNVENVKQSGDDFNYKKIRYPWTPLTDKELTYIVNDVKGLVQALKIHIPLYNKDIATTPLTSTGFVRDDCKKAMRKYNNKQLKAMLPNLESYLLGRECFRGGNVHYNRWYGHRDIYNAQSDDIASAYPWALLCGGVPMSKFIVEANCTLERLLDLIYKHDKCVMMRISFENVRLKSELYGNPYLTRDKCRNIRNGIYDNGRVLCADYLETSLTDIDFEIVNGMYDYDGCNPFYVESAIKGAIPKPLKDVVLSYYVKKTELKNVEGQEVYYQKSKELLNSIYGMIATDPVRRTIEFINGDFREKEEDLETLLEEGNKKAFLNYLWAPFITANVRKSLQYAIDKAGINFVYCDTDSVKYVGDLDLTEFNTERKLEAIKYGAVAKDKNGIEHYIGVFENENYPQPNRFRSLGAKKYCLQTEDGLHVTIAGVNKKKGAKELGTIDNFKEGFTFYDSGGTESTYNDNVYMVIEREGREIVITDNIVIQDSTYTLGITAEYLAILDRQIEIKYSDHKIPGLYEYDY